MDRIKLQTLIAEVEARSTNVESEDHGPQHWRCVALTGIRLAAHYQEKGHTAFYFGLFHDAMRENDHTDPDHGQRGADLARELCQEGFWDLDEQTLFACEIHTDIIKAADRRVCICLDADRLNLWRVGTTPDSYYLNMDKSMDLIQKTQDLHFTELTWDDVIDELEASSKPGYRPKW